MLRVLLVLAALLLVGLGGLRVTRPVSAAPDPLHCATCVGSASCKACKNCSSCKHCAKNGGTCGVCKK